MIDKKKVLGSIIVSLFLFVNVSAESASLTSVNNEYEQVVFDSNFDFKAYRNGEVIEMKWTPYEGDDFKYYKFMRSETHNNPVYPDQSAFKVLQDSNITELKISNYSSKDAVYRICVITDENGRKCSNLVKLEGFQKTEKNYKTPVTSGKTVKAKNIAYPNNTAASGINSNTAKKAKALVGKFIEKIEAKFSSDSDRIKAIESVIGKLDALAEKKPKSKRLINYINSLLKAKLEAYDNSLDEIEEIFNNL